MTNEEREGLIQDILNGKIGYYMCDPSCGLRFILPKDGDHTCPQCCREPEFMRDAQLSDLEIG